MTLLLAALLLIHGQPMEVARVLPLHAVCAPRSECAAVTDRVGNPGDHCFFTNFVYYDAPAREPIVGGDGLVLSATQWGMNGQYRFVWYNPTSHPVAIWGLSALANYNCFGANQR